MVPKHIAILCFLSDLGISIWSYNRLTNYDEYLKAAKPMISSPDLQLQVYEVLLQSFTFSLLLFLAFHFIVYILIWRQKTYAIKYIRFYCPMAILSCVLIIFSYNAFLGILPLVFYFLSFRAAGLWLKGIATQKQNSPQSSI